MSIALKARNWMTDEAVNASKSLLRKLQPGEIVAFYQVPLEALNVGNKKLGRCDATFEAMKLASERDVYIDIAQLVPVNHAKLLCDFVVAGKTATGELRMVAIEINDMMDHNQTQQVARDAVKRLCLSTMGVDYLEMPTYEVDFTSINKCLDGISKYIQQQ